MTAALKNDPLAWYRTNKLQVPPWLEEAANQSPVGSLKEL
jgi:hypothetical protein